MDDDRAGAPTSGKRWAAAAALVILAALPYLGSVGYPLLHDDRVLIHDNRWLESGANPLSVFGTEFWHGSRISGAGLYRPVTVLSLAADARLGGSPAVYRITGLLIHAFAVLAAASFLATLFQRRDPSPSPRDAGRAAWLGAALFAVHPLASEALLWVVGRAESLAAAFGLAAFVVLVGKRRGHLGSPSASAISAALFFLALGSKESAAAWIVVVAAWWAIAGRREGIAPGLLLRRTLPHMVGFAAFLLLRASVVGWGTVHAFFVDNPLVAVDPATRIANAFLLLALYGWKTLWPATLSVDWSFDQLPVLPLLPWALPAAAALAAAWAAVLRLLARHDRAAAFLWAFAPLAFAVTGNVVVPIGTNFGERLAYLALVGWCGLAALALSRISAPRRAGVAIAAVLLVLAGARSAVRAKDFRGSVELYEATVRAAPRAVKSLTSLGHVRLFKLGRPDLAIPPLERAVAIWPDYPRALDLLAQCNARLGRTMEAGRYARRAQEAAARLRREHGGPSQEVD